MNCDTAVHLPKDIAEAFRNFYSSLYDLSSPNTSVLEGEHDEAMSEYISSSQMPHLPAELAELLDAPLMVEEVQRAIKCTKTG